MRNPLDRRSVRSSGHGRKVYSSSSKETR